jgi:hypothetical protein
MRAAVCAVLHIKAWVALSASASAFCQQCFSRSHICSLHFGLTNIYLFAEGPVFFQTHALS